MAPPRSLPKWHLPKDVHKDFLRGLTLHQQGQLQRAAQLYDSVVRRNPGHFDALHHLGIIALQQGQPERAATLIGRAIGLYPGHAQAHLHHGNALQDLGRLDEASAAFARAIALQPDYAEAHYNRAIVLLQAGKLREAEAGFRQAIARRPDYAEAHNNCGTALRELGQIDAALASYTRAIQIRPDYAEAHNNRGVALRDIGRAQDGLVSFDRAIALRPDYAEAFTNRGIALHALGRLGEALASHDRAVRLQPGSAHAHSNRGLTLRAARRFAEAADCQRRAIALQPEHAEAHGNLGDALLDLNDLDGAMVSYARALELQPDLPFIAGHLAYLRMQVCDWSSRAANHAAILAGIAAGRQVATPFAVLGMTDDDTLLRRAAEIWLAAQCAGLPALPPIPSSPQRERIRLGYFSADFHAHATAFLIRGLLAQHDRARFEVIGFSFGPDTGDATRAELRNVFDRFIDVSAMTDADIAKLARDAGIDIAIDLKGFTKDARIGIFAHRAAPIQINYLGYPGTLAAGFVDYIITDPMVLPDAAAAGYTEKTIVLPDTYQPTDRNRSIAAEAGSRAAAGLPEDGFVFCCFNNNFKITPEIFARWMALLRQVDGSVLWLLADNATAVGNLRQAADSLGVAPDRLVFAARTDAATHLARHQLADLFLDTLPYNAHTTTSDALWAGLPVVTQRGRSFAGRVAASLLSAIGLPELITDSAEAYDALALELARAPARLNQLRTRLAANRLATPLFDTARYTRQLEQGYAAAYRRHLDHLPPDHIRL